MSNINSHQAQIDPLTRQLKANTEIQRHSKSFDFMRESADCNVVRVSQEYSGLRAQQSAIAGNSSGLSRAEGKARFSDFTDHLYMGKMKLNIFVLPTLWEGWLFLRRTRATPRLDGLGGHRRRYACRELAWRSSPSYWKTPPIYSNRGLKGVKSA